MVATLLNMATLVWFHIHSFIYTSSNTCPLSGTSITEWHHHDLLPPTSPCCNHVINNQSELAEPWANRIANRTPYIYTYFLFSSLFWLTINLTSLLETLVHLRNNSSFSSWQFKHNMPNGTVMCRLEISSDKCWYDSIF